MPSYVILKAHSLNSFCKYWERRWSFLLFLWEHLVWIFWSSCRTARLSVTLVKENGIFTVFLKSIWWNNKYIYDKQKRNYFPRTEKYYTTKIHTISAVLSFYSYLELTPSCKFKSQLFPKEIHILLSLQFGQTL